MSRAITTLDHETLRQVWKGLEDCVGSRLDAAQSAKFDSLKAYTFKTLLCEAVKSNQIPVVTTFFGNQKSFNLASTEWTQWLGKLYFAIAKGNLFSATVCQGPTET